VSRFRTRQYREGDGAALNALYATVTGRQRTMAEFDWQWLSAPAGRGEMWLIETDAPDGSPLVIGHHGLMPLYFSDRGTDLIAGKTENTMVHPDYRKKLLYPKFEKQFLKAYSDRFDVLFSTVGPPAALRQRRALGYRAERHWRYIEIALGPLAMVGLLASLAKATEAPSPKRALAGKMLRLGARAASGLPRYRRRNGPSLREKNGDCSVSSDFFGGFWETARRAYPITPRRNRDDLEWRFWANPNVRTRTVFTPDGGSVQGYAVITEVSRFQYRLDDIAVLPNEAEAFTALLHSVCDWCASQGAQVLSVMTTDDPSGPGAAIDRAELPRLETRWPLAKMRKATGQPMLRHATGREGRDISVSDWYVTPFVFEGRA
tara:strand:- start:3221 stop:4348 length:1128 start_codon:yes stop_codon:yes gene_type:complete